MCVSACPCVLVCEGFVLLLWAAISSCSFVKLDEFDMLLRDGLYKYCMPACAKRHPLCTDTRAHTPPIRPRG